MILVRVSDPVYRVLGGAPFVSGLEKGRGLPTSGPLCHVCGRYVLHQRGETLVVVAVRTAPLVWVPTWAHLACGPSEVIDAGEYDRRVRRQAAPRHATGLRGEHD